MGSHMYVIGPDGPVPPDIEEADLFAGTIVAEPVLILLPRFTVARLDEDGTPSDVDEFEAAIRAHGARPVRDLSFVGEPLAGWSVSITADAARITGPGMVGLLYAGSMPTVGPEWLAAVAANLRRGRGIVVITGAAASNPDAALDMIGEGRASWVRAAAELSLG